MLTRSPSAASAATGSCASFSDGTDSPVSADSSDFRPALCSRRASAGTKSPASSRMMSPGTSDAASMICSVPSRSTRACGADMLLSASSAFSALLSCSMPMTAFRMTISRISAGSKNSPGFPSTQAITNDTIAAAIRIRIITSLNWSRNRCRFVFFFFSRRTFAPCCSSRLAASAALSPCAGSVCSDCRTCSAFDEKYSTR